MTRAVFEDRLDTEIAAANLSLEELAEVFRSHMGDDARALLPYFEALSSTIQNLAVVGEELREARLNLFEAHAQAAVERQRYAELFDLAPPAYLVTDMDATIHEGNQAAAALLKVSAEHLRGKPLATFMAPDERRRLYRVLRRLKASSSTATWQTALLPRGAGPVPVEIRAGASQEEALLRLSITDLTELRQAQDAERDAMQAHTARLAGLERTKSEFLKLASHELRGPLGVARGYMSMLAEGTLGELPDPAVRAVDIVTVKLDQMNRLVNEMLDSARLEDNRLQLDRHEVDLAKATRRCVDQTRITLDGKHSIELSSPSEARVVADPGRLDTILLNLIDNAVKYSPDGGVVSVDVGVDDRCAWVTVRDRGVGITEEQMAQIFSPFGRVVSPGTSQIGGTGLGLYLSRELARKQGGELSVTSGGGETVVRLDLPRPGAPELPRQERRRATMPDRRRARRPDGVRRQEVAQGAS